MLTLWAIDKAGIPRGTLPTLEAKAVLRYNNLGTWLFTLPMHDELTRRLEPGWSVLATDQDLRFSGIIQEFLTEAKDGALSLTISGKTELHRLADRLIYPNPAQHAGSQNRARWDAKGPVETMIKELVRLNAGPSALATRRSPALEVETTRGRGKVVTVSERFSNLLEVCQKLGNNGGIRFDAHREDTGKVVLRTTPVRDLTRQVRLEVSGSLKIAASTGNAIIVAGQGEGAARTLIEVTPPPGAWGHRIEVFKDRRDSDDRTVLTQTGQETLTELGAHSSASFEVAEGPGARFATDFYLGDQVTLELGRATIAEQVTSASIDWDGHGRAITLGVGPDADSSTPTWSNRIHDLSTRLRRMEAN